MGGVGESRWVEAVNREGNPREFSAEEDGALALHLAQEDGEIGGRGRTPHVYVGGGSADAVG